MNKEISIFNYNTNNVRVITIKDNQYFCLTDVCHALDIKNTSDPIKYLNAKGVVKKSIKDVLGRTQKASFINEPNLYRLIFRSNKPQAQKFANWVYEEVLPAIRKTGAYTCQLLSNLPNDLKRALLEVRDKNNACKSVWCNITKQERDLIEILRVMTAVKSCSVQA